MSNFRSLNDLNKKDENEEKRQEYFAGGLDQRGYALSLLSRPNANLIYILHK
jgi:hypothetical protein